MVFTGTSVNCLESMMVLLYVEHHVFSSSKSYAVWKSGAVFDTELLAIIQVLSSLIFKFSETEVKLLYVTSTHSTCSVSVKGCWKAERLSQTWCSGALVHGKEANNCLCAVVVVFKCWILSCSATDDGPIQSQEAVASWTDFASGITMQLDSTN